MKALVARPETDVWALVDDLLAAGEGQAALTVAGLAPDCAKALARYVESPLAEDGTA